MSEQQKPHIYLFTGSDSFTIAEKLSFWKKEFRKKHGVSNSLIIDCESPLNPEEVIHQLTIAFQTHTLFALTKIVIIKNIFSKTALATVVREFFEKHIEAIPRSDFVVFVQEKKVQSKKNKKEEGEKENEENKEDEKESVPKKKEKKSDLAKIIGELEKTDKAQSETFDIPSGAALRRWIQARVERAGAAPSEHVIGYLIQHYGENEGPVKKYEKKPSTDLWTITHDIGKLSAYARGRTITKEDINLLIPRSPEGHIFDLADAISARDTKRALQLTHALVSGPESQMKGMCIGLTAQLIGQFRGLFLVKRLSDAGKSEGHIADILDWDPKRVWVNKKNSSRQTADGLQKILRSLIEYDYSLKTSSAHPLTALDLLICKATRK